MDINATITVNLDPSLSDEVVEALREGLEYGIRHAIGNGLLTAGAPEVEIEGYNVVVNTEGQ